jgi:hypothetical protein|tara:strand:- start:1668 stop:1862 length:195 start_codon:yes stop_codon:yes gene_type:complete
MAATVLDVLKERIESDRDSALQFLGGGGAKDFAMYKETTGLIRGLETCLSYVDDLAHRMEYDDE